MSSFLRDLRYSVRMLRKAPVFTLTSVLTLALGIGANTSVFSIINATLLHPFPGVANASSMVSLSIGGNPEVPMLFSYPDYLELRQRTCSFTQLTAFGIWAMDLTGNGKPEHVWGSQVSGDYFDVLSVRPILGRTFLRAETEKIGGAPLAVISYRLWRRNMGGDPAVVGRTVHINQFPFTIIGVAPPLFQGTVTGLRMELWVPIVMQPQLVRDGGFLEYRDARWLVPLGRLQPGVSKLQAQEELNLIMQEIVARYPESHRGRNDISVYPLWRAPGANAYLSTILPMLMAIAGLVLLLACANVANLLLARSVSRRQEMAIRLAVGASRQRLLLQLLIESLCLSLAGGFVACLFTFFTAHGFRRLIPPTSLPVALDVITVDRFVLLVTFAVSVISSLLFGILPALRTSSITPYAVLKEETGSASGGLHKARLSSALVVGQVSLAVFLLICAGLLIRTFRNMQAFDPGFSPDHILIASFDLGPSGYSRERLVAFYRQVISRIEKYPGVEGATLANWFPLGFDAKSTTFEAEDYIPQAHESMEIHDATVGPLYLRTMRIPLLAGREFSDFDGPETEPVAIVNRAFANRYWPRQDALGKRVNILGRWRRIVGIAHDSNYIKLGEPPQPFLYLDWLQLAPQRSIIHVKVAGDTLAYVPAVESAVHELHADLPLYDAGSLASHIEIANLTQRIAGTFVGVFGAVALALAAVGLYGVVSYNTHQRRHEFGIRMALGGQQRNILILVVTQGLALTLTGIVIGLALSLAMTRLLRSQLFGVTATDPFTFVTVALVLIVVAVLAAFLPANHATRVDPSAALRCE